MIKVLESEGFNTSEEIVNGILDKKEEAFPLLARLATCDEYWDDGGGNLLAPICAIHLLAKIGHYRAQLAISAAMMEHHGDTGDWLTEDSPQVLAHMGAGAIRTLLALMNDADAYLFVRDSAARALCTIASEHPEEKPGIIASIKETIRNDEDLEIVSLLAYAMFQLGDPETYEYLKRLVEANFVDPFFFDQRDLDDVRTGRRPPPHLESWDPMYMFSDDNPYKINWRRMEESRASREKTDRRKQPKKPATRRPALPRIAGQKIGRNWPCLCGSGRKYKKCCMPKA